MVASERDNGRQPWNERAVRCALEHLAAAAAGRDQLVLVHLARHAHPGGCGIAVGLRGLQQMTGYNRRTLMAALDALLAAGVLVRVGRGPHGVYRHRIVLCQRCSGYTAAPPCQRCSFNTAARRRRQPSSGAAGTPEQKELQVMPAATPVSTSGRPLAAATDGHGRHSGSAGSAAADRAANQPGQPSSNGDATASRHLSPFQAIPAAPTHDGEPAAPHHDATPAATTREPVSNPRRRSA